MTKNTNCEVPETLRAVIVAYRFHLDIKMKEIAESLGLPIGTIKTICHRAKKRSESSSLEDLIEAAKVRPRSGRPPRAGAGGALALAVRKGVLEGDYLPEIPVANKILQSYNRTLRELDNNEAINRKPLGPSQVHNILRSKRHAEADSQLPKPIKRVRECRNSELSEVNISKRIDYGNDIDEAYRDDAIFISADEVTIHFGGSGTRHRSVLEGYTPRGTTLREWFSLEQWAAACGDDVSVERPHCIFEVMKENSKEWKADLKKAKEILIKELGERWKRCLQPGTTEHELYTVKQQEVDDDNANRQLYGIPGRRHQMTPQRAIPYEPIHKAEDNKRGLTFTFVAFEIYRKRLFPYARQIQANNPSRPVFIQEDNDPSHVKARLLLAPEIYELEKDGIRFANHPPASPDLAPIETLHKVENQALEAYRFSVRTSAKHKRIEAGKKMETWWKSSEADKAVAYYVTMEWYKEMLDRCREAGGGNDFKDSW